jgi:hypothetical protein
MNETEIKICNVLNWNFENFQTFFLWTQWFMQRWDDYVDDSLSYLKQQFHLKFYEKGCKESHKKFFTLMNFIDILVMSYDAKNYPPRLLIAAVMYLIIGGKDIMHAFQMEYNQMSFLFKDQLPILDHSQQSKARLSEGILFYN